MMNEETTTNRHPLRDGGKVEWWLENDDMKGLPDHIVEKLEAAGYSTAEDIKAAGSKRIREIDGIGKVAFNEIKLWLASLGD